MKPVVKYSRPSLVKKLYFSELAIECSKSVKLMLLLRTHITSFSPIISSFFW